MAEGVFYVQGQSALGSPANQNFISNAGFVIADGGVVVIDALGSSNASVLDALAGQDCLTIRTYQYSADIAAVGPNGRGYRRTRVVFDVGDGTPRVVYRQDLTHLGWALGTEARNSLLMARNTR